MNIRVFFYMLVKAYEFINQQVLVVSGCYYFMFLSQSYYFKYITNLKKKMSKQIHKSFVYNDYINFLYSHAVIRLLYHNRRKKASLPIATKI